MDGFFSHISALQSATEIRYLFENSGNFHPAKKIKDFVGVMTCETATTIRKVYL